MPTSFLTDKQRRRYGRFTGEPTPEQLDRFFHLDERDRALVDKRRGEHNQLGFAVQLSTVRFLGTFLANPVDVPPNIVDHLAFQLNVTGPSSLALYAQREQTHREHAGEIQREYCYVDFADLSAKFRLTRWLYTRAWVNAIRPIVLFDLATARLVERKVLLPGVTTIERLVARVLDHANARLWRLLCRGVDDEARARLDALLEVPNEGTKSPLGRLRQPPGNPTADGVKAALERLREFRDLGVGDIDISTVSPSRLSALARHAAGVRAQAIVRMSDERRIATLLAFARVFESKACDDVIVLLNAVLAKYSSTVERLSKKERLRTLKSFDTAALQLREACLVLLDMSYDDIGRLREAIFQQSSRKKLETATQVIGGLARAPDDNNYDELIGRFHLICRFLPLFLEIIELDGNADARPVLDAIETLRRFEDDKRASLTEADLPSEIIGRRWRELVFDERGQVIRRAWTFCALEQLQAAWKRRDVFVIGSEKWTDPRARLLAGRAWETVRPQVCRTLGLSAEPEPTLKAIAAELDDAWRHCAERFPENTAVRIEEKDGHDHLVLRNLEGIDEDPRVTDLRDRVHKLLPRVDLPGLLLEVAQWTGFCDELTHVSEGNARADNLTTSICAALMAKACNIGIKDVATPDVPALTESRIGWIAQNYLRPETIIRANAQLVEHQISIPLARLWGGGDVAVADGLRFVVPVRGLHTGPNRRYFGVKRGVTYYNFTSGFAGFHAIVVPGTLRDSLFILDGLLEHETSLDPDEVITDTAAYSDIVFGLFRLLGYQFSPRLANVGSARFWRIDKEADYGPLNGIARHCVNTDRVVTHYDDMLRVAGSLLRGKVKASDLLRTFQPDGTPTALARALGEFGRVAKTLHMLPYIDDETYRRHVLIQTNHQESRHGLARTVFHGKRGELHHGYRDGQEEQLGALGLVVNAIILWNTRYIDAAIQHVCSMGIEVPDEHVQHLWPLGHKHIRLLGYYRFELPDPIREGHLRPLRQL